MRKRNLTGLLFAAAFVMAGTQFGQCGGAGKTALWRGLGGQMEDRWDDDRWDDDDDDDCWDDDDDDRWMMTVGTMMMTIVGKADTVMEMGIMEAVITASTVRQQEEQ